MINTKENNQSWCEIANILTDLNIPHTVVSKLADVQLAMIIGRPVFNIFKFDEYLHQRFGDYEAEGKSMRDMFAILFKDKANQVAYLFGVE